MANQSSNSLPAPHNMVNIIPTKLNSGNYLTWKSLFLPILRKYKVLDLVDGSSICPAKYSRTATGVLSDEINSSYIEWIDRDQTLLIWLNSTISDSLLPYVVGATTSRDLWLTLEKRFSFLSTAHVIQLQTDLEISDRLAASGSPASDRDLVVHTLNGLPPEYESFVTGIKLRNPPVTADELHGLLISQELSINRAHSMVTQEPQSHAYSSVQTGNSQHKSSGFQSNRGKGRGRGQGFHSHGGSSSQHTNGNNSSNYNTNSTSTNRPVCQICGKLGHLAIDCYNRLNLSYLGKTPPTKLQAMIAGTSNDPGYWYADTGASTHITADIQNLDIHKEYKGKEKVEVGNGQGSQFREDSFPRTN